MLKCFVKTVLIICFCTNGFAQELPFYSMSNVAEFKTKMAETAIKTKTIASEFVQKKHLSFMEEEIVSKGLFFKKENLVRWEYLTPHPYAIVINNNKIFVIDENGQNKLDARSSKVFKKINDMMMGFTQGDLFDNNDFSINYLENNKRYLLELTPTAERMKKFLKRIDVSFDKTDYSVVKFKMLELSEDYTTIDFFNKRINEDISAEKFRIN